MNKLGWRAKGTTLTQRELDAYIKSRALPGVVELTGYGKGKGKYEIEITHGLCPNNTCGHTYMLECERADCKGRCRGTCT